MKGIDYRSPGRVLVKSILQQDESAGGGSTLTQQLAKIFIPAALLDTAILLNKMREYRIAGKLEDLYTKEELLTLYLNTVPFADNVGRD